MTSLKVGTVMLRSAFGWEEFDGVPANTNKGLVLHYDGSKTLMLTKKEHPECLRYWRNTRVMHMGTTRKWKDIGYSYGICPHGIIFTGRGYGFVQAAQRSEKGKIPEGNIRWVSCTLMLSVGEEPTKKQIEGVIKLRHMLKEEHPTFADSVIMGHRQFTSTDCPGDIIFKKIKAGVFNDSK